MAPTEPSITDDVRQSPVTTFLFTDIEGSTRLWEEHPDEMREALARHDATSRAIVQEQRGQVVKTTGDGMYAAFIDPLDGIDAAVALQRALSDAQVIAGAPLRVRCGLHAGVVELRDHDFFGTVVNRTQRIMSCGHGGQVLVSQVVADLVRDRLPRETQLHDLGDVRLRDVAMPEHLYQVVHPALRTDFPPLRSLAATPNNLPQQITSFVGRGRELEEVRALVARTRLLTLHGAGGIGKTRLSLQIAGEMLDRFPDGVWFVELAGLSDPALVPQTLASALGVKEEAGRSVLEALLKCVADRTMLIVLDNCEHLVQACAELARGLLQAGSHIAIVASSREPLRIAGELTYSVPALSTPGAGATHDLASFGQYEAVRLFAERAAAVRASFSVTPQNAEAIADICRRLDGIPLALELAAARVRAMSVEQIASRLNDRFALLTSGDRTALPRQQTLRALIDWSYELLSEPERALLRRLAAFAAGFSLDAAEAVGASDAVERNRVLDLCGELVDKSLLVLDPEGDRYRLLETVQQYARERLAQSNEEHQARDAHLRHYLALAQQARPQLVGPRQRAWLQRLDAERANLLAAHAWCDQAQNGAELGLQLVSATRRYWIFGGLLDTGYRITTEALARPGAQARGVARCQALFDAGQIGSWMGRYADAQRYLEESLGIAREIGDKRLMAIVLQPLAIACMGRGDFACAREHLTAGVALSRELGDRRELAAALIALAQVHRLDGNLDACEPLYRDALAIARELEDLEIIGLGLLNLSMVAIGRETTAPARAMLTEALDVIDKAGSKPAGQSLLEVCAGLAACLGDWQSAARFFGAAEAQMNDTGLHRDAADEAFIKPLLTRVRSALGGEPFEAALAQGQALEFGAAIADVRQWLTASAGPS